MTRPARYRGIFTATCTPIDATGRVVASVARAHVEAQLASGITGLLPIGGTGEFTALDDAQRIAMLEVTVEAAAGRVPVVASVLHPGLQDTIRAARDYLRAGADSVMIVTPFYSRPTQQGMVDYFRRVSDAVDGDMVLYEIPYRTGVSLLPETVERIVSQTRTVAMKACNPDLHQQMRVAQAVGNRIAILSGEESVFPLHVAMGAVGGMLASSNLLPRAWCQIFSLAERGDLTAAMALHARLQPIIEALYSEPNPGPIKAALRLLDLDHGAVIEPLVPASDACVEQLRQVLKNALDIERGLASTLSPHSP
ncbi:4-hydroxy-tetrahydrodipicolinate synthase [Ramlibacter sp.]|uniref:4-hydroxy-tetrahydrodipicolinate synthase n=1 Tax=Ramlibacter sp. TaxID=1917967 RepID=UPI0035ADA400